MPRIKNYLNNKDLLIEIKLAQEHGQVSNNLGKMLILLSQRFANRGNFRNYSYIDLMKDEAVICMLVAVPKFNFERSSNPFAYLTQTCRNAFLKILKQESKQHHIRDDMLEYSGITPSTSRQQYNDENMSSEPIITKITKNRPKRGD